MAQNPSSETMGKLDEAAHQLIDSAEQKAVEILRERRDVLKALAEALLERETLTESEVAEVPSSSASPRVARNGQSRRKPKVTTERDHA